MDFRLLDLRNIFIVFGPIPVTNTKFVWLQKTLTMLFFSQTTTYNNSKIS